MLFRLAGNPFFAAAGGSALAARFAARLEEAREHLHQALTEADEELFVALGSGPVGPAGFREGEDLGGRVLDELDALGILEKLPDSGNAHGAEQIGQQAAGLHDVADVPPAHVAEQVELDADTVDVAAVLRDETESAMAAFKGKVKGSLNLGGSTIPGEYILPELIGKFNKTYPNLMVKLTIADSSEIENRVLALQNNLECVVLLLD